jgi:hypothetical protein
VLGQLGHPFVESLLGRPIGLSHVDVETLQLCWFGHSASTASVRCPLSPGDARSFASPTLKGEIPSEGFMRVRLHRATERFEDAVCKLNIGGRP